MSVTLLLRLELLSLSRHNFRVDFRLKRLDALHQQFIAALQYRPFVGLVTHCFDQFVRCAPSQLAPGEFVLGKEGNGRKNDHVEQGQQCNQLFCAECEIQSTLNKLLTHLTSTYLPYDVGKCWIKYKTPFRKT